MLGFVIQRFLQALAVMTVMSIIVFCGVYAIGNPIDIVLPPEATQDIREEVIRRLGLDRPLFEQYFIFMKNLLQLDLEHSGFTSLNQKSGSGTALRFTALFLAGG